MDIDGGDLSEPRDELDDDNVSKDVIMAKAGNFNIRSEWKKGSSVKIYSDSKAKWTKGVIIKIFTDNEGEWLRIKYDGTSMKEVQRWANCVKSIGDHDDDDASPNARSQSIWDEWNGTGNMALRNKGYISLLFMCANILNHWERIRKYNAKWKAEDVLTIIINYINECYMMKFVYDGINDKLKSIIIKSMNGTQQTWYRICIIQNNLTKSNWNFHDEKKNNPDKPEFQHQFQKKKNW